MEDVLLKLIEKASGRAAVKGIVAGRATEITATTCTLVREGAPELHGVRLHAVVDDLQSSVTIIPKEGSYVLAGIIEGLKTEAAVIACSEIERVLVKIDTVSYECTATGHGIKKENDSLKKILADLISEIEKIYAPKNAAAIAAIKVRSNNLLT